MPENIKSFSEYISESVKEITISFGRLNPPTTGHEKLLDSLARVAARGPYRLYVSQSQDSKKNPLEYTQKVKYIRKMLPRHARSVILDKSIHNIFDVLTKLYEEGFTQVNMVVGSDRVTEFETITNKYNGVKGRHGFYNFEGGVNVISAGDRDPDAEGVTGMSASKMRSAANANDFQTFSKGLPSGFKEGKELFNDVRKGMGLTESHDFRSHIQLHSVSEDREAYVAGNLFSTGDFVIITATEEMGTISFLGTNYVIVETFEGKKYRKWISDVEHIDESVKSITFDPKIDRAIDRLVHRKKYANAVKAHLQTKKDLWKVAQMFGLDYRNLKKSVDKVLNEVKGLMEGENVDRVQQEKQDALDKLDQEYERKIERAKQADETQAEQEKRRQEAEDEAEDESENQNESVKPFIQYLEEKCEMISYNDIKELEKVFSKKFDDFDIDFRFTRHFSDRVSDDRNNPCITTKELKSLFNRLYMSKRQGRNIFSRWPDMEIVMKDVRNNINIPFSIEYNKSTDEFEVIAKTIMRKKNFKSSGPVVKV